MIRSYATQPHYQHHINNHTTDTTPINPHTTKPTPQPIITASRPDAATLHDAGWSNIVLIEHGAGQGYRHSDGVHVDASNDRAVNPSVRWWWGPNWLAWRAVRERLPNAVPVLMAPHVWQLGMARAYGPNIRLPDVSTVGFAVHWPNPVCPEARGGWPHTASVIAHLKRRMPQVQIVVFPHPKMNVGGVRRHDVVRRNPDIIVDPDWPSWVADVDVLVADNTSVMWEAAAIGIPVVGHRPPVWREWDRMPHHGLRFPGYRHIPMGRDATTPRDIVDHIESLIVDGTDTADTKLWRDVDSWIYPTLHETPDRLAAAITAIGE